ncbi:MAG: hypothetical protein HY257_03380, partial [Chloroflexi bacterium]|nr:hypothetical protein [Chloroflexota bacterium]
LNENRIDDALQFAAEAVRLSTRPENFYGSGMAHRVWAETLSRTSPPRWDQAKEHLKISLEIFEHGGALLEAARTRALWGKLARGRGMMAEAREQWSIAAQQFELSGAAVELKQIKSWHAQLPAKSVQTLKIGLSK